MNCLKCNKILERRDQKKFCSKSCAGSYNGVLYPKRSKERANWPKCRTCDNTVVAKYYVYCRTCIDNRKHFHGIPADLQTIEQASRRGGANRYDLIRTHARRLYKEELKSGCEKCGYDKHVELCHINAISSFNKQVTIAEVNQRDNIMFLCPNCHWEHDHIITS
jgi:hypothetical protein